jgi:hypothetical protein
VHFQVGIGILHKLPKYWNSHQTLHDRPLAFVEDAVLWWQLLAFLCGLFARVELVVTQVGLRLAEHREEHGEQDEDRAEEVDQEEDRINVCPVTRFDPTPVILR